MEEESVIDLRAYLRVLRRRRALIFVVFIGIVAATAAITWRMTPIYQGFARVEVQPVSSSSSDVRILESLIDPTRTLQTQVELIRSRAVLREAAKLLGLPTTKELEQALEVELVRDTQIIEIKVEHERPSEARAWANAVATSYIQFRRDRAIETTLAASEDIETRIEGVKRRITEMDGEGQRTTSTATTSKAERDRLVAQLNALETQRQALPQESILQRGGGTTINAAELPTAPVKPRKLVNLGLAIVVALLLGVALAFLAETLDDRMKSPEEVEERMGAPILGYIPYVQEWTKHPEGFLATVHEPASGAVEAYRTLRTNLKFVSLEDPLKTVLVTSATAGAGKTTTAANLAVTLSQAGSKVIVVSADLRRPSIHKVFGLSNESGVTNVLDPATPLASALQANAIPNLRLLAAGGLPPNPTEILGSGRFAQVLEELENIADIVIVDAPPMLGLGDTSALAARADGVIFVVDVKQVTSKEVQHAVDQLNKAGGKIIGVVLNGVEPDEGYGYYYHYYYAQYGSSSQGPGRSMQSKEKS